MTLVLSPHCDDAVLSCADWILQEQRRGKTVTVWTLFTHFTPPGKKVTQLSPEIQKYLHASKAHSLSEFEAMRQQEDRKALHRLKWKVHHLGYTDGGFRFNKTQPVYTGNLFSGHLAVEDLALQEKILYELDVKMKKNTQHWTQIVAPFAVGNHADHWITRLAAEHLAHKWNIPLYLFVDYPYALHPKAWLTQPKLFFSFLESIFFFIRNPKIQWRQSSLKRQSLNEYGSQIPLLFPSGIPWYPEILIPQKV